MHSKFFRTILGRLTSIVAFIAMMSPLAIPSANAQDAARLKARHAILRPQLLDNQFHRPFHLESSVDKGLMTGEVYAEIDKPYSTIATALQGTDHWCDILILHLNVKSCRAAIDKTHESLSMHIGRKFDQQLDDTYAFEFRYKTAAAKSNYFQATLISAAGPMGTSDYRVAIEVVQLDTRRSFLHLSYAYKYGVIANVAMHSYLATGGRHKVGFSTAGRKPNGQPLYLGGIRGVIERNTMRYYLAIEAYVGAPGTSAAQLKKRLDDWHSGVERYPLQLHEMERDAYLEMKHKEFARQQTPTILATAH
jgi:hypothetical protein